MSSHSCLWSHLILYLPKFSGFANCTYCFFFNFHYAISSYELLSFMLCYISHILPGLSVSHRVNFLVGINSNYMFHFHLVDIMFFWFCLHLLKFDGFTFGMICLCFHVYMPLVLMNLSFIFNNISHIGSFLTLSKLTYISWTPSYWCLLHVN